MPLLIDKIKQKNGLGFKLMDAADVEMPDGKDVVQAIDEIKEEAKDSAKMFYASTSDVLPSDVLKALYDGKLVRIMHQENIHILVSFSVFEYYIAQDHLVSSATFTFGDEVYYATLTGDLETDIWSFEAVPFALKDDIPKMATEVDITGFDSEGIIKESFDDGTEVTYTFTYDEETDSTTITDTNGNETLVKGMAPGGGSGEDGFSPIVEITNIIGGHRVSITDINGTKNFDVLDGEDGANGKDGTNGTDGEDGFSPVIAVAEIEGGHRVLVTDVSGTKTFDVMDGTNGEDGGTLSPLMGSTAEVTPMEVATALSEGRPIIIGGTDPTYGEIKFSNFRYAVSMNAVADSVTINFFGNILSAGLMGDIASGEWILSVTQLAKKEDVPKALTAVDFSGFESSGRIVETYSDGSSLTHSFEFDSEGNPTKITDSNGNVITLTW